jgi:hypothetical protein
MSECLPDLPRHIRQAGSHWEGADRPAGPWRPIPAPQSGLPWPTDEPAVPESREPASVASEARPLSPAAQAIVEAFDDRHENCGQWDDDWQEQCLAAALFAVADQVMPHEVVPPLMKGHELERLCQRQHSRTQLLAIAAELEGSNA